MASAPQYNVQDPRTNTLPHAPIKRKPLPPGYNAAGNTYSVENHGGVPPQPVRTEPNIIPVRHPESEPESESGDSDGESAYHTSRSMPQQPRPTMMPPDRPLPPHLPPGPHHYVGNPAAAYPQQPPMTYSGANPRTANVGPGPPDSERGYNRHDPGSDADYYTDPESDIDDRRSESSISSTEHKEIRVVSRRRRIIDSQEKKKRRRHKPKPTTDQPTDGVHIQRWRGREDGIVLCNWNDEYVPKPTRWIEQKGLKDKDKNTQPGMSFYHYWCDKRHNGDSTLEEFDFAVCSKNSSSRPPPERSYYRQYQQQQQQLPELLGCICVATAPRTRKAVVGFRLTSEGRQHIKEHKAVGEAFMAGVLARFTVALLEEWSWLGSVVTGIQVAGACEGADRWEHEWQMAMFKGAGYEESKGKARDGYKSFHFDRQTTEVGEIVARWKGGWVEMAIEDLAELSPDAPLGCWSCIGACCKIMVGGWCLCLCCAGCGN